MTDQILSEEQKHEHGVNAIARAIGTLATKQRLPAEWVVEAALRSSLGLLLASGCSLSEARRLLIDFAEGLEDTDNVTAIRN
jgi:hypothetical protein